MAIATAIALLTDAVAVANAVAPLVQQFTETGKEPTDDEVRQALAGKDAALKRFDEIIAQKGG